MRPLIATLFGSGSRRRWVALGVVVIAPVALLCGCEADTPSGPGPSGEGGSTVDGGDGGEGGSTGVGLCQDGTTRRCEVELPTHRNVTSCFEGVQTCVDGHWGPCTDAVAEPPPPEDGPLAAGSGSPVEALGSPAAQTPESAAAAACSCVDAA